jgi:hypothetical protein
MEGHGFRLLHYSLSAIAMIDLFWLTGREVLANTRIASGFPASGEPDRLHLELSPLGECE